MAKYLVTVRLELTAGNPFSDDQIEELKRDIAQTVTGMPGLPGEAFSESRGVDIQPA